MALRPQQKLGLAITIVMMIGIAGATLYPTPQQAQTAGDTSIWCLLCGDLGVVDVVLNILLFIPFGIGLSLLGLTRWRALVIVGLTTLTVEVLQLSIVFGRDASLSDLLTNSIGGLLGIWLGPNLGRVLFPAPRVGFWLATAWMLFWMAQQAFTGWALGRQLPPSVYFGQWAPELGQFDRFTGSVTEVTLNGLRLGNGRFDRSDEIRTELGKTGIEIEVLAESGERTRRTAPIFSIFDDRQREILLVGTSGSNLIFHIRTKLDRLRLRSPSITLPGAIPEGPGRAMAVRVKYNGARYRLETRQGNNRASRDVPVSASWGWSFLLPFSYDFGSGARWLTMLWLAGFWLPIGYWAARSGDGRPFLWGGFITVTLLIGLVGIPSLFGLEPSAPSEWAGAIFGAALGWVLGTSFQSWRSPSASASSLS